MKSNSFHSFSKLIILVVLTFGISGSIWCQVQYSGTVNTGTTASAINFETQATGNSSFASGYQSIASGHISTAMGYQSIAAGTRSFAIGEYTFSASQAYSFGQAAKANASHSLAIGIFVETDLIAFNSIVLGSGSSSCILKNNIGNSLMVAFNSTIPTFFVSEAESSTNNKGIGKIGIGTSNPVARLQVADGDIFIQDINKGIIMKSPDGNCWRGTLNNNGQLEFVQLIDCESLVITKTNELEQKSSIKIYPNPASKYIDITCSDEERGLYKTITLNSIIGNMILTLPLTSTSTRISLDNLEPGSYVINVSGKDKSFSEKVIIK